MPTSNDPVHTEIAKKSLRSAEMAAGIKAYIQPEPAKKGLTSFKGRVIAQIICNLPGNKNILSYGNARETVLTRLAKQHLQTVDGEATYVEMAAGFSTRGMEIARDPSIDVIEVDLPAVVEAKQSRTRTLMGPNQPDNLSWCAADLSQTPLGEILPSKPVDMVVSEGMLIYFPPEEIRTIAATVADVLKPGGIFITEAFGSGGMNIAEQESGLVTKLVQKKAGDFKGQFDSHQQVKDLFQEAGFGDVEVEGLSELNESIGAAYDIPEGGIVIQARKTSAD